MKISLGMELNFSLAEIDDAAKQFITAIGDRKVMAFNGDMGAGKTTFIHGVGRALGVKNNMSSPTFSIINEYLLADGSIMYHMDLYRIKDEAEAIAAGVEDCLSSGNRCMVEWPEKAAGLFDDETLYCTLNVAADNRRLLRINL
jgi:tRNA threonylcarbamoyladenosine biosynthesis protein TsaE